VETISKSIIPLKGKSKLATILIKNSSVSKETPGTSIKSFVLGKKYRISRKDEEKGLARVQSRGGPVRTE